MLVRQEPDVVFTPDPQTEATCSLAASFDGCMRNANTNTKDDANTTVFSHLAILRWVRKAGENIKEMKMRMRMRKTKREIGFRGNQRVRVCAVV